MVDIQVFLLDHIDVIIVHLVNHSIEFSVRNYIPTEIFQLCTILLPFGYFLNPVEACHCSLASIAIGTEFVSRLTPYIPNTENECNASHIL
jgi:hypothetical protein